MRLIGRMVAYAIFFAVVGLLSVKPTLRLLADNDAVVSVSFSHASQRIGECKRLSQDELMALPPNMRKPDECPRERFPLLFSLQMDKKTVFEATSQPSGLWADGKSTVYQRIRVAAGTYELTARMNDSGTSGTFDFEDSAIIQLRPGQNLVVYFDPTDQQFHFQ